MLLSTFTPRTRYHLPNSSDLWQIAERKIPRKNHKKEGLQIKSNESGATVYAVFHSSILHVHKIMHGMENTMLLGSLNPQRNHSSITIWSSLRADLACVNNIYRGINESNDRWMMLKACQTLSGVWKTVWVFPVPPTGVGAANGRRRYPPRPALHRALLSFTKYNAALSLLSLVFF